MKPQVLDATCGHSNCDGKSTYDMSGRCLNCGWQGLVRLTQGHATIGWRGDCPRCGCREVTAREWAGGA